MAGGPGRVNGSKAEEGQGPTVLPSCITFLRSFRMMEHISQAGNFFCWSVCVCFNFQTTAQYNKKGEEKPDNIWAAALMLLYWLWSSNANQKGKKKAILTPFLVPQSATVHKLPSTIIITSFSRPSITAWQICSSSFWSWISPSFFSFTISRGVFPSPFHNSASTWKSQWAAKVSVLT